MLRKAAVVIAVASTPSASFYVTGIQNLQKSLINLEILTFYFAAASKVAASYIEHGLAPPIPDMNQSGFSLAIVALVVFICFVLSIYFRPCACPLHHNQIHMVRSNFDQLCFRYHESFANNLDAYIDFSVIVFMIPMALPSDSMFYNETQDQALLFTVAGMIGLANWFSSPPHPPPPSTLTATLYAEYPTDNRYLSLAVLLFCIRLDVRGKGVHLPDWLQASECITITIVFHSSFDCEINYDNCITHVSSSACTKFLSRVSNPNLQKYTTGSK
jgi:hypothetical protein